MTGICDTNCLDMHVEQGAKNRHGRFVSEVFTVFVIGVVSPPAQTNVASEARKAVAKDTHSNVEIVTSARQERMRLLGLMRARMHRDKKHLMKAFARPLVLKAFDACKIVRPVIYDLCMCICICSKLAYFKTSKFSVHD